MKKITTMLLLYLVLVSCSKDNEAMDNEDPTKKIEKIVYYDNKQDFENGAQSIASYTYKYDQQGRLQALLRGDKTKLQFEYTDKNEIFKIKLYEEDLVRFTDYTFIYNTGLPISLKAVGHYNYETDIILDEDDILIFKDKNNKNNFVYSPNFTTGRFESYKDPSGKEHQFRIHITQHRNGLKSPNNTMLLLLLIRPDIAINYVQRGVTLTPIEIGSYTDKGKEIYGHVFESDEEHYILGKTIYAPNGRSTGYVKYIYTTN